MITCLSVIWISQLQRFFDLQMLIMVSKGDTDMSPDTHGAWCLRSMDGCQLFISLVKGQSNIVRHRMVLWRFHLYVVWNSMLLCVLLSELKAELIHIWKSMKEKWPCSVKGIAWSGEPMYSLSAHCFGFTAGKELVFWWTLPVLIAWFPAAAGSSD